MDKFEALREHNTCAPNYDISTEQMIEKLTAWDQMYGIEMSDVEDDRLTVHFQRLPKDLDSLVADIYEFCPDIVDQGFACFEDMLESADPDSEMTANLRELAEGIDFEDDDFAFELLKKSLRRDQTIGLWWD